jgi:hypothetical protein
VIEALKPGWLSNAQAKRQMNLPKYHHEVHNTFDSMYTSIMA